jgi:Helix-turn-helix of DDE superfamily endonuclease
MKPSLTDIDALPHRWRNLVPRTGLTVGQVHTVCALTRQRQPPAPGRPWGLALPVRVLLVLIHLRTNLTTRGLAALFDTSQSAVDRIIHHVVPVLARTLHPDPDTSDHPWIIDGTLIPVHDQSITAISKNYRRSVNTQLIICSQRRRVLVAGKCWPGNRNDVIVARHTVVHMLDGRVVLGDGGTAASLRSSAPRDATTPAASSTTTTTGHTAGSEPASNTSSPGSKAGKYCGNAAAVATPSTTASTSSPDSGTSRSAINYGSTLSLHVEGDRLRPVDGADLAKNALHMCLDRFDRDDKFVGDLGIRGSQHQPFENLPFTVR